MSIKAEIISKQLDLMIEQSELYAKHAVQWRELLPKCRGDRDEYIAVLALTQTAIANLEESNKECNALIKLLLNAREG